MVTILQRKKYERIIYSRPTIVVLIILIIFLGKAVINVYQKAQKTKENLSIAEAELDALIDRETLLKDKLKVLGTEKGVEAEIRDKFNVVKEGEKVIVIIQDDTNNTLDDTNNKKSIWQFILSIFKKK